jgi:hypothetical protein
MINPFTHLWTDKKLSEYQKEFGETAEQMFNNVDRLNYAPPNSGLLHTNTLSPQTNFIDAPSQHKIDFKNSAIIFGLDRPGSLETGYGRSGAQRSETIDIVVGRLSAADGGAGPSTGDNVDPSFGLDAARIYISQMTDIDLNLGLAKGKIGSIAAHSAIGIKADGIRIVGREGVKIVTGRSFKFEGIGPDGETNSFGGSIEPAPPIELIAGNSDSVKTVGGGPLKLPKTSINTLQPLVKGENSRDAIEELGDLVEELIGTIQNMALIQITANSAFGVGPNPVHATAAGIAGIQYLSKVIGPLWQTRINKIMWKINYLEPYGYKYICSKNVYST